MATTLTKKKFDRRIKYEQIKVKSKQIKEVKNNEFKTTNRKLQSI